MKNRIPAYGHMRALVYALGVALPLLTLTPVSTGCKKRVRPTTLHVVDSIRHYYPIVSGEKLSVVYTVVNTGDDPFIFDDIQPSCGCITGDVDALTIPPHDSLRLAFVFDSKKNIGYVSHSIRLFGNVMPKGMATLVFDVNVVPPSTHTPDYEEIYQSENDATIKELVDGTAAQKGYYLDPDDSHDSREHAKYPWRE